MLISGAFLKCFSIVSIDIFGRMKQKLRAVNFSDTCMVSSWAHSSFIKRTFEVKLYRIAAE